MRALSAFLVLIFFSSCNSPNFKLTDSEKIVYLAIFNWAQKNGKNTYEEYWGNDSEYISDRVWDELNKTKNEIVIDPTPILFNNYIKKLEYPVDNYAFIEIDCIDPFYAYKYVVVFKNENGWKIIDDFVIGEDLIETLSVSFDWCQFSVKMHQ